MLTFNDSPVDVAEDKKETEIHTASEENEEKNITENTETENIQKELPKAVKYDENQGYVSDSDSAKWYVVHTYSGHEMKVKANIEKIVDNRGMQDLILEIVLPTEDVVEMKNGQRKVKTKKIFPGYVIVKMIVTNESWYLVRNTQGVTGFVGCGTEPISLTDDEVRRMGLEKVKVNLDVEVGDSVKVISGPFESFMGVVDEINMEKEMLSVIVSMFGRDTKVELEFGLVDKI